MAKYYIKKNGKTLYVKNIDYANGKLEFTTDVGEAYKGRDGFYANATKDFLRRGFSEEYPEVADLKCTDTYY